ncbi:hypothetical protein [Candidatus Pantoea formicae]|uniref:hypothetical protein n=1 Tax=Candidatus Pantoea formicae TaxID=2608355 RepID=UPI003ED98DB7
MKQDKQKPADKDKVLHNMIKMRRWSIIGGLAVGAQVLLNIVTDPGSNISIFQAVLALGCIGYGLSMTPKIRKLSQAGDNEK